MHYVSETDRQRKYSNQYNMYILLTKWEYINICCYFSVENIC